MRFVRRGRRSSASRPEKSPADDIGIGGTYDIVIVEDIEHYIPVNDGVHATASTCACDPLLARRVGTSGWLHRSIPAPL